MPGQGLGLRAIVGDGVHAPALRPPLPLHAIAGAEPVVRRLPFFAPPPPSMPPPATPREPTPRCVPPVTPREPTPRLAPPATPREPTPRLPAPATPREPTPRVPQPATPREPTPRVQQPRTPREPTPRIPPPITPRTHLPRTSTACTGIHRGEPRRSSSSSRLSHVLQVHRRAQLLREYQSGGSPVRPSAALNALPFDSPPPPGAGGEVAPPLVQPEDCSTPPSPPPPGDHASPVWVQTGLLPSPTAAQKPSVPLWYASSSSDNDSAAEESTVPPAAQRRARNVQLDRPFRRTLVLPAAPASEAMAGGKRQTAARPRSSGARTRSVHRAPDDVGVTLEEALVAAAAGYEVDRDLGPAMVVLNRRAHRSMRPHTSGGRRRRPRRPPSRSRPQSRRRPKPRAVSAHPRRLAPSRLRQDAGLVQTRTLSDDAEAPATSGELFPSSAVLLHSPDASSAEDTEPSVPAAFRSIIPQLRLLPLLNATADGDGPVTPLQSSAVCSATESPRSDVAGGEAAQGGAPLSPGVWSSRSSPNPSGCVSADDHQAYELAHGVVRRPGSSTSGGNSCSSEEERPVRHRKLPLSDEAFGTFDGHGGDGGDGDGGDGGRGDSDDSVVGLADLPHRLLSVWEPLPAPVTYPAELSDVEAHVGAPVNPLVTATPVPVADKPPVGHARPKSAVSMLARAAKRLPVAPFGLVQREPVVLSKPHVAALHSARSSDAQSTSAVSDSGSELDLISWAQSRAARPSAAAASTPKSKPTSTARPSALVWTMRASSNSVSTHVWGSSRPSRKGRSAADTVAGQAMLEKHRRRASAALRKPK